MCIFERVEMKCIFYVCVCVCVRACVHACMRSVSYVTNSASLRGPAHPYGEMDWTGPDWTGVFVENVCVCVCVCVWGWVGLWR